MRPLSRLFASVGMLLLSSCQQTPPDAPSELGWIKDWDTLNITLERGPCYGSCPIYSVQIHGDGSVIYQGVNFVGTTGRQSSRISLDAVRVLARKFEAADFFSLNNEYRAQITDGPTYTVTLAHDGQTKSVIDYLGGAVNMPKAISEIEEAIDIAAGAAKWVEGYVPRAH